MALYVSTDTGQNQLFKKLLVKPNSLDTQHLGIHERVDGTTHRISEPRNGSTAVFKNNFKHLMMTTVGRNMQFNVQ
jgi:hypothetical protein